jgi:hypothetical protein
MLILSVARRRCRIAAVGSSNIPDIVGADDPVRDTTSRSGRATT